MRVVIVGAGDIGVEVGRILARRKANEIVILESDELRCKAVSNELDALVIHGDGTHPEALSRAGLDKTQALVAVTGSDAINTVVAMLGHRASVPKIIVRLDDVALRAACQEIGVSEIIAPKLTAAARVVSVLYGFHRLDFSLATRGGLRLVELPPGDAAGKKLEAAGLPDDVLVVAVLRDGESEIARGSTRIESDDTLLVLVPDEQAIRRTRRALGLIS